MHRHFGRSKGWLLIFGFVLGGLFFTPRPFASANDWQSALSLDQQGKAQDALRLFLSHPSDDAPYFYNVGSLYYKLGQPGPAVAYLEKAKRLKPHDPDIQNNLRVAQAALGELIGTHRLNPASNWVEDLADPISLDEVRGILGLVALILVLIWIRAYAKTNDLNKTFFQPAGFFGLLGLGITVGLYSAQRLARDHPPVVCIQPETIRSGPGDQFLELAQESPGVKLRLLGSSSNEQNEQWYQVRYARGKIGWARASGLLLL